VKTRGELALAVDDVVVYASHGVGRVAIRRPESVVVEFAKGGLSITLPIERAAECIRPVSTEAEIADLGQTLSGAESAAEPNWQRRLKAARAKVASGDALDLAEVIRDTSRRGERATARSEPGKISLTERQLYLKARQLLADEIGASRGVDPALADEWIGDQIAVNGPGPVNGPGQMTVVQPVELTVEASGNRARRRRH
jgi:CarD family transcriptional regulator